MNQTIHLFDVEVENDNNNLWFMNCVYVAMVFSIKIGKNLF